MDYHDYGWTSKVCFYAIVAMAVCILATLISRLM